MGDDFSNHQVFAGLEDAPSRADLIERLRQFMRQQGLVEVAQEEQAERSLVVGPAERWIFIGDSAGSTEWADPEAFGDLSRALSLLAPVVDIKMSDSAAVHFYLYRNGALVDKFGNAAFPFYRFATTEEAMAYRGVPEQWTDLLVDGGSLDALRAAWVQDWNASTALFKTGNILGWNPTLQNLGYTFDYEGLPEKYDTVLQCRQIDLGPFIELHYRLNG